LNVFANTETYIEESYQNEPALQVFHGLPIARNDMQADTAETARMQRRADNGANAQAPAHLIAFVRLSISLIGESP
jgi:hypothetical protein